MGFRIAAALFLGLVAVEPAFAEGVGEQIDAARTAYAKGDSLHALSALQAAIAVLNSRLADQFSKVLPPAPGGWDAGSVDVQSLDTIGGGISLSKGYSKGESTLNATLIVDNPAVGASAAMFQPTSQVDGRPGWSRLQLASEEALVRYDGAARSGEILLLIGGRVLLQVEGTEIANRDILVDAAKGWNIGAIRKLIAPGP